MIRLADGERDAVGPVYAGLWPPVRDFVGRALGPDHASADDVAQAALLRLFERAPDFDRDRDALTWALSVAAWEVRTERTRGRRQGARSGAMPNDAAAVDDPEKDALAAQARAQLSQAIDTLSPQDRAVLRRVLEDDADPSARFRKQKQRAVERLRRAFRRLYGVP